MSFLPRPRVGRAPLIRWVAVACALTFRSYRLPASPRAGRRLLGNHPEDLEVELRLDVLRSATRVAEGITQQRDSRTDHQAGHHADDEVQDLARPDRVRRGGRRVDDLDRWDPDRDRRSGAGRDLLLVVDLLGLPH